MRHSTTASGALILDRWFQHRAWPDLLLVVPATSLLFAVGCFYSTRELSNFVFFRCLTAISEYRRLFSSCFELWMLYWWVTFISLPDVLWNRDIVNFRTSARNFNKPKIAGRCLEHILCCQLGALLHFVISYLSVLSFKLGEVLFWCKNSNFPTYTRYMYIYMYM